MMDFEIPKSIMVESMEVMGGMTTLSAKPKSGILGKVNKGYRSSKLGLLDMVSDGWCLITNYEYRKNFRWHRE